MKLESGKFIALQKAKHGLNEYYFFLKVKRDRNGNFWFIVDDLPKQLLDEDARRELLDETQLVKHLRSNEKPEFSKVRVTIEAISKHGTSHRWKKMSGEALERLIMAFPELIDCYFLSQERRDKLKKYILGRLRMK